MSLRYQTPIIYNYDIKKYYNQLLRTNCPETLLNKQNNSNCYFINKYGKICNNKCLETSTFILREFFCDYHIKNHIDDIIKINTFIFNFTLTVNYINNILLNTYTRTQLQTEFTNCKKYIKMLYSLIHNNKNYIIMTQPVIDIVHGLLFKYFQNNIYDMNLYKLNLNQLKFYNYNYIINDNIKKRKDTIDTLLCLIYDNNTSIGKVFLTTNIGDINIFKIIESFV